MPGGPTATQAGQRGIDPLRDIVPLVGRGAGNVLALIEPAGEQGTAFALNHAVINKGRPIQKIGQPFRGIVIRLERVHRLLRPSWPRPGRIVGFVAPLAGVDFRHEGIGLCHQAKGSDATEP